MGSLISNSRRAPGPPTLHVLRNLPRLRNAPHQVFLEWRQAYGDFVRLPGWPGAPVFLVSHPRYVKHILLDHYRKYRKSSHLQRIREQGFGNGLVNSEGELWQRQRRTLQSHFHGAAIEPFVRVMDLETETTVLRWREAAANARPIDLETEMLDLLTRITSRGLFGQPLGDVVAKARLAFLRAARTSPLWGGLPSPAQWDLSRQNRRLRRLVEDIIRDPPPEASESLLPILAHARDPHTGVVMNERQLADELVTLLYTGLETSALTLTWFWYLLARNVEVEEEIRRQAVVARAEGDLVPDILDASLHEVLRLYPPSWAIGRVAIVPDEIEGFEVPAGSKLILSQYVVHRHPEFWTDPEEFRPERFRSGPPDPSREISYFPFGAGPRICLGRELAEREAGRVAGRLLTEFHLRPISNDPAGIEPTVTLKPLRRIKMWVEPWT